MINHMHLCFINYIFIGFGKLMGVGFYRRGFSLLELSVVLVIIAVITGMGMVAGRGALEASRREATERKMDAIENALKDFRIRNNRLPCPTTYSKLSSSSDYGLEEWGSGNNHYGCILDSLTYFDSVAEGGVPARTLGLPDEFMLDGWGRKMRYAVDINAAMSEAFSTIRPRSSCGISVLDFPRNASTGVYGGTSYSRTTDRPLSVFGNLGSADAYVLSFSDSEGNDATRRDAQGAIYTLVSHGENGHGALTFNGTSPLSAGSSASLAEQANCHCDSSAASIDYRDMYVQADAYSSDNTAENFDDIVRFKMRYQLQTPSDMDNFGDYIGPELATVNSSNELALYRNDCGYWRRVHISGSNNPASDSPTALFFSPQNDLFVYGGGSCNQYAYGVVESSSQLFTTEGVYYDGVLGSVENINGVSAICDGSGDASVRFAIAPRAGIVVATWAGSSTGSDYLEVWRYSYQTHYYKYGRTENETFLEDSSGADTQLIAAPVIQAITPDGKYLFLGDTSGYATVYKISSDANGIKYREISAQPDYNGYSFNKMRAVAFSPDNRYMAVAYNNEVQMWSINPLTDEMTMLSSAPDISSLLNDELNGITFSPDGNYLAVTSQYGGASSFYENVNVFKLLHATDSNEITFIEALGPNVTEVAPAPAGESQIAAYGDISGLGASAPAAPMFTSDSRYLIASVPSSDSGNWTMASFRILGIYKGGVQPVYIGDQNTSYGNFEGSPVSDKPVINTAVSN